MADASNTVAQPGIAALAPPTIRQLGSGQVLVDPSSVVKELIENALDARAKSIFVDISANTIDSIQVKDDGHGIPSEDRSLVCRRYCTSKIRDLNDLREIGGKWLGFRGEALASMAEMSSAFSVTTRVEGEPVAVKLKYSRGGELESVTHDSHPVGTTVKVTGFFDYIPVRKQTAIRNVAKCLAKIRRLMQSYALARPTIRFRLRVLKAKNSNGDFSYAPRAHADVGDAVLKTFGRDCAAQCDFTTAEADGFEIRAFLPKPIAIGSKISGHGSFVAVDARPVSSNRGTIKQMVHVHKQRLGKANASLTGVRDPFFCINIICPPGSYDPNIEPAKDDVMFEDSDIVLGVWEKLLGSFYPEAVVNLDEDEPSLYFQQNCQIEPGNIVEQNLDEITSESHNTSDQNEASVSAPQPRWRHSMYGIDEEDLEFLKDDCTPIIDEEEGRYAAEVSNPWTIARMNAAIKPRGSASNGRLLRPAKSTGNVDSSSSPRILATPNRVVSPEPLTPQTSSKANMVQSVLDDELQRSIQRLPPQSSGAESINDWFLNRQGSQSINDTSTHVSRGEVPTSVLRSETRAPETRTSQLSQYGNIAPEIALPEEAPPLIQNQFMVRKTTRQKKAKDAIAPLVATNNSQRRLVGAVQQEEAIRPLPVKHTDIRDFFNQRSEIQEIHPIQNPSFTPINPPAQSQPRSSTSFALHHSPSFLQNRKNNLHSISPVAHCPASQTTRTAARNETHTSPPPPPHNELATQATISRRTSTDSMTSFFRTQEDKAAIHPSQRLAHDTRIPPAPPHGQIPQPACSLTLHLTISILSIMSLALVYRESSLNWDAAARCAYCGFGADVSDGRIAEWVGRIDGKLRGTYGRVSDIGMAVMVLEEGVKRALEGIECEEEGEEEGEEEMLMDM